MAVDNQILELLRDRFDSQDVMLKRIENTLESHIEKDEHYWKEIDNHNAQLRLAKWLGGSALVTIGAKWLYELLNR